MKCTTLASCYLKFMKAPVIHHFVFHSFFALTVQHLSLGKLLYTFSLSLWDESHAL